MVTSPPAPFSRLKSRPHPMLPPFRPPAQDVLSVAPVLVQTDRCDACGEILIQKDAGVLLCPECGEIRCSTDSLGESADAPSYHYRKAQYLAQILTLLCGQVSGSRESDPPKWVLEGVCAWLAQRQLAMDDVTVEHVVGALDQITHPETGEKAKRYVRVRVRIFYLITRRRRPQLPPAAMESIKTIFTGVVCGPFRKIIGCKKKTRTNFENYTRYCQMAMLTYRRELVKSAETAEAGRRQALLMEVDNLDHFQRLRVFEVPNGSPAAYQTKIAQVKAIWLQCYDELHPGLLTAADLNWDDILSRKRKRA